MRLLVLHNPAAGRRQIGRDALLKLMRRFGHILVCCTSKDQDWQQALDDSLDLLVAAGGDGTVAKLGRAATARRVPIAVLPLGTANNIASALGLADRTIEELVAGWADAEHQPFDLGVARGPWGTCHFLESVGIGVLAEMIAQVDDSNGASINSIEDADLRIAAARQVCERVLSRLAPIELELTLDERRQRGTYVLMEALNFGAAGPNLRLTPTGNCSDGLLDVVLVDDEHRPELVEHLQDGSQIPAGLTVQQARRVLVNCPPCTLHIDDRIRTGTTASRDMPIELTVEPGALTFLVPRSP